MSAPPSSAAAEEIAALLASPPDWLDVSRAHDPGLSPLQPDKQRGRSKAMKLASRWECTIKGPAGSPYMGGFYRVLVRLPVGYPALPPKIHVLNAIMSHLEVEVRDPYEGEMDESFYEELTRRTVAAASPATANNSSASGANGAGAPSQARHSTSNRRFSVGDRVECKVAAHQWASGRVIALDYSEPSWPPDKVAPYQVRLDDGRLVFAPMDSNKVIRELEDSADGALSGSEAGTPLHYSIRGALQLFVDALKGPLNPPEEEGGGSLGAGGSAGARAPSVPSTAAVAAAAAAAADNDSVNGVDEERAEGAVGAEGDEGEEGEGEAGAGSDGGGGETTTRQEYESAWASVAARHADDLMTIATYRAKCRYPELFTGTFDAAWLAPSLAAAFAAPSASASTVEAALRGVLEEVSPGIYAFDMLTHEFCDRLLAELEHYEASGLPVARPNSMNNYGVILNTIGMEATMDDLQRKYVAPLAQMLFPVEGEHVDHHHAFMVTYKQGEDLGLDMHTDACDVTLNVCLGRDFTGAGLTFCGLRGVNGSHERKFSYRHEHVKGRAILHLGNHRHGADDIVTGERFNLILWNKSSSFRVTRDFMQKYSQPPSSRGPPDLVCLSYTHDRDYEEHKPYPPGKRPKPGRCQGG